MIEVKDVDVCIGRGGVYGLFYLLNSVYTIEEGKDGSLIIRDNGVQVSDWEECMFVGVMRGYL